MPSNSPSLTLGGKIVAGAGALFLIVTFLPWFSFTSQAFGTSYSTNLNAWKFGLTKAAALLVILVLAEVILVQVAKVRLPDGAPWGVIRLAASGLAALLVVAKLIKGQSIDVPDLSSLKSLSASLGSTVDLDIDYSFDRGIGLYLGLLLVIALVAGNALRLNEVPAAPAPSAGQPGAWGSAGAGQPGGWGPAGESQPGQSGGWGSAGAGQQFGPSQNQAQNQAQADPQFGQNQYGQGQYDQTRYDYDQTRPAPGQPYGQPVQNPQYGQGGQQDQFGQYGQDPYGQGQSGQGRPGQGQQPGQYGQ